MAGWAKPHEVNYIWEHVDRNKKSLTLNLKSAEGQEIIYKLVEGADVFLNNLRPYHPLGVGIPLARLGLSQHHRSPG